MRKLLLTIAITLTAMMTSEAQQLTEYKEMDIIHQTTLDSYFKLGYSSEIDEYFFVSHDHNYSYLNVKAWLWIKKKQDLVNLLEYAVVMKSSDKKAFGESTIFKNFGGIYIINEEGGMLRFSKSTAKKMLKKLKNR